MRPLAFVRGGGGEDGALNVADPCAFNEKQIAIRRLYVPTATLYLIKIENQFGLRAHAKP